MIKQGLRTSKDNILLLLQECALKREVMVGRELHSFIVGCGLDSDNCFGSHIIHMYTSFGSLSEANCTFGYVSNPSASTWGTIVSAHAKLGEVEMALQFYHKMQQNNIKLNDSGFSCMVKACSSLGIVGVAEAVKMMSQQGLPISNNFVHSLLQGCSKTKDLTACRHLRELMNQLGLDSVAPFGDQLIRLFTCCRSLVEANQAFCKIMNRSVYTWNAIISAHVNLGESERALDLFDIMQHEGIVPNKFILTCVLKACSSIGAIRHGRMIHDQIIWTESDFDVEVGNALIDMYSKCGELAEAYEVFNELANPDVGSWGAMIAGVSQHGHDLASIELYGRMEQEGVSPNRVVFLFILKACGSVGALLKGRLIHGQIIKHRLQSDPLVESALLDMYANCGSLEDLQKMFYLMPKRDVVSWGALLGGYAHYSDYQQVVECLQDMQKEGIKPDAVILTSVLTACSHAGYLEKGFWHFRTMVEDSGIVPSTTHYNCLIDLLSRLGCLPEAEGLLQTMPVSPDIIGWKCLLTSCKTHGNTDLGQRCFDEAARLDPDDSAGYLLMSSIYSDMHMWDDADAVQIVRITADAGKKPGMAWTEVNNKVNEFIVGETCRSDSNTIDAKFVRLNKLLKQDDYVAQLDLVF